MTLKTAMRGEHLEPPPWVYARMAKGSRMRLIYRLFAGDLAQTLPIGSHLLDVGTGPGYLPAYLSRMRPDLKIWGVDVSVEMIRRAKPRQAVLSSQNEVCWMVADACLLPFQSEFFDQVVATFSFHIWPCPIAGLKELQRVLKPGGRAWVYELRREATIFDLKAFARYLKMPFPLVYLGFKIISRHHAVPAPEFAHNLRQAAGDRGTLHAIHNIFWRAEL